MTTTPEPPDYDALARELARGGSLDVIEVGGQWLLRKDAITAALRAAHAAGVRAAAELVRDFSGPVFVRSWFAADLAAAVLALAPPQ